VRGGRGSVRLFAVLAVLVTFWITAGLGRAGLSQPYSSRYLYVGATFIVLLGAELLRTVRIAPLVAGVVALLILAATVSNLRLFSDAGGFERGIGQGTKADLAALDIGREAVAPSYVPIRFPGLGLTFTAGAYYAVQRDIGTPAVSPAQLLKLPEGPRQAADQELLSMHAVTLRPAAVRGRRCTSAAQFTLPAGGVTVRGSGPAVSVSARRFADRFSPVGSFAGTGARVLRIGSDRSDVPWRVHVTSTGRFAVCGW
jgi:hypothetical protein